MAEPTSSAARPAHAGGLELRLERGGAYVALQAEAPWPGVELRALSMEVPGVRLPFDVAGGAAQFQGRLCELDRVEVAASAEALAARAAALPLAGTGLSRLAAAPRSGFLELWGALDDGAPFTAKGALAAPEAGPGVALQLCAIRLWGPSAAPATAVPARLARALAPLAAGASAGEGEGLALDPLPALLRRALPPRGFKVPRAGAVRLAEVEISPEGVRLAWDRAAALAAPADPDLLLELEGARAFREAERRLAAGDAAGALTAYRALDRAALAHPFASGRLLSLLGVAPAHRAEALALATQALARRPDDPGLLAALARVRAARGEPAAATQARAAAAAAAAARGEERAALCAADACFALGAPGDPAAQARAAEVALAVRRDHLAALRALVALGERGEDREALLRACRRLAAYAPEPEEKAAAHARLGALLAQDPAAARLHLDHALRLARAPAALRALACACEAAGEHVRAVKALDRLRETALEAGDAALAAEADEEAAGCWERAGQPENAALRRAACSRAATPRDPAIAAGTAHPSIRPDAARLEPEREVPVAEVAPPPADRGGGRAPAPRPLVDVAVSGGGPAPSPPPAAGASALPAALAQARAAPLDPAALGALARHAASAAPWGEPPERRRLELLARSAAALAAFAAGVPAAPEEASARVLPPPVREAARHPFSRAALPRLLALLAPSLEALYLADLAQRGVGPGDALSASREPALLARLETAREALDARACTAYLRAGEGLEVALENTAPPALVLGGGFARAPAARARFLLARGLALVGQGWAVAGRVGPDGRTVLCQLACRFAGAAVEPALPPARVRALLAALERVTPPPLRAQAAALAGPAAAELPAARQPRLAAAARRTASRLALLHAGAPGEALAALLESERPLRERPRAAALAHGDVVDLAAFALSDLWLGFRAEAP